MELQRLQCLGYSRGVLNRRQKCVHWKGIECSHKSSLEFRKKSRHLLNTKSFSTDVKNSIIAPASVGSPSISENEIIKVAFFDVDGTIVKSNVVLAYVTLRLTEISFLAKLVWVPYFAAKGLVYLTLDRIDRALFNRYFYRIYENRSVSSKDAMADLIHVNYLKPNVFGRAISHIRLLQQSGYRIVLVTGSLDFIVAPLARELGVDAVFAAKLKEMDGKFTGELEGDAISSKEKSLIVQSYAAEHGISLSDCHAYGDSIADLNMLESVGFPHAVLPDSRLKAIAMERSWPVLDWSLKESEKEVLE